MEETANHAAEVPHLVWAGVWQWPDSINTALASNVGVSTGAIVTPSSWPPVRWWPAAVSAPLHWTATTTREGERRTRRRQERGR